jgi:Ca2+-binding RTX toxin-like protein
VFEKHRPSHFGAAALSLVVQGNPGRAENASTKGDTISATYSMNRGTTTSEDRVTSGDGNDKLDGGLGDDLLVGGAGNDTLSVAPGPTASYSA